MLFVKNRLIIGVILTAIFTIFKIIYKFFKLLNLQYAIFVGIVGLILWLTGVFNTPIYKVIFFIVLGLSVMLGAVLTGRKIFGKKKKDKKSKK